MISCAIDFKYIIVLLTTYFLSVIYLGCLGVYYLVKTLGGYVGVYLGGFAAFVA